MTDTAATQQTIWNATGKPITGIGAGRFRLTPEYLYFERGTLSLKAEQIRCSEIHDVDFRQSLTQKARGVGTISLKADRQGGAETVLLEDIPNFREGVEAINNAAHAARELLRQREQTTTVNYTGIPPTAAPATAASAGGDLNAELQKLATFREQGILSEEEFTAAKRKLLGL